MNIRKQLEEHAEKEYQKFSASLIPNINNVLGVRLPILRKFSKEIVKSSDLRAFLEINEFKYMEEYALKGMVIGLLKLPINEVLMHIKEFVPTIDNWSVCDSFCNSLKITNENLSNVWEFLQPYFSSKNEYELRFAYVMLLNYYLIDDYIEKIFFIVDKFKDERYYAKMAVAWLVSICFIKYPKETKEYLKKSKLDDWTFNKSIQKICESLKVDKKTKQSLKQLKRY